MTIQTEANRTAAARTIRAALTHLLAAGAMLAGCDSGGGDPSSNPPPDDGPLYAVEGTVFGPEGESSYVALVPSLDAGTQIDYGQVLEVPGGASIFGLDGSRFFALGRGDAPTITRFEVTASGSFVEGQTLSLLNQGIGHTWFDPGLVPILSDDKAYVIDSQQMQVVVWNPSTMTVTGTFALPGVAAEGYSTTLFEPDPTRRGDHLFVAALHGEGDATAPFSTLLVLDVVHDRVAAVVRESRCGGLWDSVLAPSGDIYLATGVWDAAQHRAFGDSIATEPCIVRVPAGSLELDGDYYVPTASITGGQAAGGLVPGPAGSAYVKALDETGLEPIGPEDFDEVWSGAHWRWRSWSLGSAAAAAEVPGVPASAGASGVLSVDGRAYVRNASADFSETTLLDMGDAIPTEGLTLRGFPYGIVRIF